MLMYLELAVMLERINMHLEHPVEVITSQWQMLVVDMRSQSHGKIRQRRAGIADRGIAIF